MNNQYSKIALAPNASHRIAGTARFFRFVEGSAGGADTTIMVQPVGGGDAVLLRPGQGFDTSQFDRQHSDWIISNYIGQGTIIGTVMLGDIKLDDDRITGSVEVIDGGKARTLAGVAFLAATGHAAGAGLYTAIQLWNPDAARRVVIERIILSSPVAGSIRMAIRNVMNAGASVACASKKSGGAASSALIKLDSVGPGAFNGQLSIYLQANTTFDIDLREPIVIDAGYGLTILADTAAAGLTANFEFFEEGTV